MSVRADSRVFLCSLPGIAGAVLLARDIRCLEVGVAFGRILHVAGVGLRLPDYLQPFGRDTAVCGLSFSGGTSPAIRALEPGGNMPMMPMMPMLRRILTAPFIALGSCVVRAALAALLATSPKTTYRGIRILLSPCEDDANREPIEFARELLDLLHEREPHRFNRLRQAVDNMMLTPDAGGGLYVPQTRTLVIDLSYLGDYADEDRCLVQGLCAALVLYHVTYHKLDRLRIRGDASRDDRLDRLCTREVARWYPEIYEGIDWDEVDDQTKESRRHTSGLSLLERYRERKRAFQTNPLTEETTSPHG